MTNNLQYCLPICVYFTKTDCYIRNLNSFEKEKIQTLTLSKYCIIGKIHQNKWLLKGNLV
jgi:spore maturation protein CgeB